MKTLHFFETKRPILTFQAETTEFAPESGAYLIQATGEITFQDTPLLEELLHSDVACFLRVEENGETLLDGRFNVTFLVLEPDQLVARISPAD